MNRKNHNCILKCPQIEDQIQSFSKCPHILNGIDVAYTASYESIVGALSGEINIMSVFSKIEDKRNHKKKHCLLPGGRTCQDPCTFGFISVGATDTSAPCYSIKVYFVMTKQVQVNSWHL